MKQEDKDNKIHYHDNQNINNIQHNNHEGHQHHNHEQMNHSGHEGHQHHNHVHMDHSGHKKHQHHNHEHMNHNRHGGHSGHHGHMVEDFKKRFWISLILAIPISILSHMTQMIFGYEVDFTGDRWILFILSTIIFFYGGKPFLQGARDELKSKDPGMIVYGKLIM